MISETAFHGVRALSIEWQPVLKLCEASFRKKKEKKKVLSDHCSRNFCNGEHMIDGIITKSVFKIQIINYILQKMFKHF